MRKYKEHVIFSLLIFSICYGITMTADSPCGDWESYKDEKCIKIIDETLRTYDDAMKTCQQQENGSRLVSIRSLEEQEFFSNLLFKTHKVVDTVWIGAKYSSNKFKWADDSDVSFTNWADGSPSNIADKACVQMIPDGSSMGKWADEPCNKKNLVVCQKVQTWPISSLQEILLEVRRELKVTQQQQLNLQTNPVPIGFIYVQLPSQPEPKTFWKMVEWKDITSEYAGLFFRAEGGGSVKFEEMQEENSPHLTQVKFIFPDSADHQSLNGGIVNVNPGQWSRDIYTGANSGSNCYLSFLSSSGEVRPRNKAMRIWKRIK